MGKHVLACAMPGLWVALLFGIKVMVLACIPVAASRFDAIEYVDAYETPIAWPHATVVLLGAWGIFAVGMALFAIECKSLFYTRSSRIGRYGYILAIYVVTGIVLYGPYALWPITEGFASLIRFGSLRIAPGLIAHTIVLGALAIHGLIIISTKSRWMDRTLPTRKESPLMTILYGPAGPNVASLFSMLPCLSFTGIILLIGWTADPRPETLIGPGLLLLLLIAMIDLCSAFEKRFRLWERCALRQKIEYVLLWNALFFAGALFMSFALHDNGISEEAITIVGLLSLHLIWFVPVLLITLAIRRIWVIVTSIQAWTVRHFLPS